MSRAVTLFGALVPCRRLTRRRCIPVAVKSSRSARSTFDHNPVDGGVESRIPRYLYVTSSSEEGGAYGIRVGVGVSPGVEYEWWCG